MNQKKKIFIFSIVVFVAVIIPIFLKLFSNSVFQIPVLIEQTKVQSCENELYEELNEQINVVLIKNENCDSPDCKKEIDQLKRVAQRYSELSELSFKIIANSPFQLTWNYQNINVISNKRLLDLTCLAPDLGVKNTLLLFDKKNNLRGIYEINRDEVDRLIIELDILNQFEN